MQVVKQYPNGVFNWVDLATTDIAGAKSFYGALFGWEAIDLPTDQGAPYTMFTLNGYNVAGGSQMTPDLQASGMPPVWSSYIKHDDVDAVAAKVKEAGGSFMMEPMDVMDSGRMMFVFDPSGAAFGVWQPKNHIGADLVNIPNTLVWNELQTREVAACQQFYSDLFGWTYKSDENGYVMCLADGRTQAGMLQIDDSWGDVPNNWNVYFYVEDVAAKLEQGQSLGGNVLVPATPAGELGKFAVIQDPQGGVFTIMEFQGRVDPPPGY